MDSSAPVYKKRFGFYNLCLTIAYFFYSLIMTFFYPNEMAVIDALKFINLDYSFVLEDKGNLYTVALLSHERMYIGLNKILFIISATLSIVFYSYLLWEPKLTMEKGHFLKLYTGFFVTASLWSLNSALFITSNSSKFCSFFEKLGDAVSNSPNLNIYPKLLSSIQDFQWIFSVLSRFNILVYLFFAILAVIGTLLSTSIYTLDEEYDGFGSSLKCFKPYRRVESLPTIYSKDEPVKFVQLIPVADSEKSKAY